MTLTREQAETPTLEEWFRDTPHMPFLLANIDCHLRTMLDLDNEELVRLRRLLMISIRGSVQSLLQSQESPAARGWPTPQEMHEWAEDFENQEMMKGRFGLPDYRDTYIYLSQFRPALPEVLSERAKEQLMVEYKSWMACARWMLNRLKGGV